MLLAGGVLCLAQEPGPASRLDGLTPLGKEPDWNLLKDYAGCVTEAEVKRALAEVYLEKPGFPLPWTLQSQAVVIQTGRVDEPVVAVPLAQRGQEAEKAMRFWRRADELPPLEGRPPLSDVHVAIDPGHLGGAYAQMEERHLSLQPGEAIQEGDLTLLTARVLEERLKGLGAYVTLVRKEAQPVTRQTPATLRHVALDTLKAAGFPEAKESYAGLTGDAKLLTVQWQSEKLFYRVSEIQARAVLVNEQIKPDVVLCLHFNAEPWGTGPDPMLSPVNHLHVLVNGCYSPAELALQDTRFEMFRRLFTQVHEEEIPLAVAVAQGLAESTGLPPYQYTTPVAKPARGSPYVYARNLLANRLYQCPVVYLEPYVMNNLETYQRLLRGHWVGRTLIGEKLERSAIEDYVRGVVQGLLNHYQPRRST